MLSSGDFVLQPKIESLITDITPDSAIPEDLSAQLKPYRVLRKKLASLCLFLVITIIILGLQVYANFSPVLTFMLISFAGIFAWRGNKTLIRFGWV